MAVEGTPSFSITFPGAPDYLRLARLATADAGTRVGFDYEQIDDLRIAVSELCALISGAPDTTLTLEFLLEPEGVTVAGHAEPGALVENELSRAIVQAVSDEFEVGVSDGASRFRVTKRLAPS